MIKIRNIIGQNRGEEGASVDKDHLEKRRAEPEKGWQGHAGFLLGGSSPTT